MFQGVNQFFVFATLLSTGIGAFATPTPRQQGTSAILATSQHLCLDAGDGSLNSPVMFNICSQDNPKQEWILEDAGGDKQIIESISSSNCAGIGNGGFITLQSCEGLKNPFLLWNVEADVPTIGNAEFDVCFKVDADKKAIFAPCSSDDADQFMEVVDN